MGENIVRKGLDGVVVAESGMSYIDGEKGILIYRGHLIEDLAEKSNFEEVLYLLWNERLPKKSELKEFKEILKDKRELPEGILRAIEELTIQGETPMAALRTAVSMISAYDNDEEVVGDIDLIFKRGMNITAKIPTIIAAFDQFRRGEKDIKPRRDLDHAANFLYMLTGETPDEVLSKTLDIALILHCDHGLNASTFAARVTVSTLADIYSAITSAIGCLSGPLHGGANQKVMKMLLEIEDEKIKPEVWVKNELNGGRKIPGFGHRVYKIKDPRADILGEMSESMGISKGDLKWHEYSRIIEKYVEEKKGLAANVDFYSASAYYQMGIASDLYTPIFAMSRIGGWVGHIIEQYSENRLIRPRANYVGMMESTYTPIDKR
jgi:citrate synthase